MEFVRDLLEHFSPHLKSVAAINVPSYLRGRACGKKNAMQQFPTAKQWILMSYAWYSDVHLMGIKLLDCGLWSGELRLDLGRATLGECHMSLISLLSWVTSVKKIQALTHRYVPLKHYAFPRTLKKIPGNIVCYTLWKQNFRNLSQLHSIFIYIFYAVGLNLW